jgi:hypothetical protein
VNTFNFVVCTHCYRSVVHNNISYVFNRYLDADYYRRRRRVEKEDGMNFIESIFSFVFGDGDPNDGLEDKRWKMVKAFHRPYSCFCF